MITDEETRRIGTLTRLHGRRGEVQCLLDNDFWDQADPAFVILRLQNILVPFRILDWREKGTDGLILQLDGVNSEQQALPLLGAEVRLLRTDIHSDEDDEDILTWQDLVGYQVLAMDQTDMGRLIHIDESTANILGTTDTDKLVPLHEDLIISLQPDNQIIQLNIPSSL